MHPTRAEFDEILNHYLGERIAGRPKQGINEVSTLQNYAIGARLQLGGDVYYYAKAGGAINRPDMGVKNGLPQGIAQRAIVANVPIGGKSVTLTTTATDGAAGTGLINADEFKGGKIVFFTVGAVAPFDSQIRRIIGNTARIAGGNLPVTFTFEPGLSIALVAGSSVAEAMQSIYSNVILSANGGLPVVGIPTVMAALGQFLWLLTWGISWISPQALVGVAGNTGLVFRHDGSLEPIINTAGVISVPDGLSTTQHAGFVLAETLTNTQAAPFVMFQISP